MSPFKPADRAQLDKIANDWRGVSHLRLTAVGHSDQLLIAARNRAVYADNYALSRARAEVVAKYLAERLSIDPSRVDDRRPRFRRAAGDGPRSCEPRAQPPRRHRDRRSARRRRRQPHGEDRGRRRAGRDGRHAGRLRLRARRPPRRRFAPPPSAKSTSNSCSRAPLGSRPPQDEIPSIPSLRIVVQHAPTQTIELQNNGSVVSPLNFDGVETNEAATVSVSRWRGVDLRDGKNELIAIVRDAEGNELQRLTRTVHYAGGAVRAEIVREASTLVADGRTRPVIAVRMIDSASKPARPGTQGAFSVAGAVSLVVGSRIAGRQQAGRRGHARADVQRRCRWPRAPGAGADDASRHRRSCGCASASVASRKSACGWSRRRATGSSSASPKNTAAYRTISDNMQSAADAGLEEGYATDGRVAFFAKGAIKGEYLLTAAYDSARDHEVAKDRLLGIGGAGSLLHAVRRCDRAALRSCDVAQAVPEAGAPPVRRAVRRLRDRPDADRAHALQPYVHGPEVRLRRRALRLQRVRRRVRAGLREGRAAGRRHLGPVSAVAPPDHPQQRQDPPRSARPLPQRSRGRVAAALAVRRLQHRLSQRHAVLQAAGAEPRPGLQPGVHHRRVRSAQRRRSADDRWRSRRGQARERQHRDRRELPAGRRRGGRQHGSPARICAGRSVLRPSCAQKWLAASRTIRCVQRAPMRISPKSCT